MTLKSIIVNLLTVSFSSITLIHVYWFLGGEKGLDAALPHDIEILKNKFSLPVIRLINAFLLAPVILVFCMLILSLHDGFLLIAPYKKQIYFWFSILFILRGVLGWLLLNKFTKKEIFIRNNTFIYSPISLVLGVLLMGLYLL